MISHAFVGQVTTDYVAVLLQHKEGRPSGRPFDFWKKAGTSALSLLN